MAWVKYGKVTSVHVSFDNLGFMQQLGLAPPPAHAEVKPTGVGSKVTTR